MFLLGICNVILGIIIAGLIAPHFLMFMIFLLSFLVEDFDEVLLLFLDFVESNELLRDPINEYFFEQICHLYKSLLFQLK